MTSKSYFNQNLIVNTLYRNTTRLNFFENFVKGKNVLHVGFADYPITDISQNLHLHLSSFCKKLDGVDLNLNDSIRELLSVPNGELYSSWENIKDCYDVIIVPEVIEHVDNLKDFIAFFDNYKGSLIITAPDAYILSKNFKEVSNGEYNFQETIHPDHNCWFSPYTLKNVINKYSKTRQVNELFWLKGSIAAICN